jgi:hypothetical protein
MHAKQNMFSESNKTKPVFRKQQLILIDGVYFLKKSRARQLIGWLAIKGLAS